MGPSCTTPAVSGPNSPTLQLLPQRRAGVVIIGEYAAWSRIIEWGWQGHREWRCGLGPYCRMGLADTEVRVVLTLRFETKLPDWSGSTRWLNRIERVRSESEQRPARRPACAGDRCRPAGEAHAGGSPERAARAVRGSCGPNTGVKLSAALESSWDGCGVAFAHPVCWERCPSWRAFQQCETGDLVRAAPQAAMRAASDG